jgi:hypothetical protein
VIPLPAERASAYLRALDAGLHAVGLGADHPSLEGASRVIGVLDPAFSGELFAPPAVSAPSGLPAHAWWSRALAERRAAPLAPPPPGGDGAAARMRIRAEATARLAAGPAFQPGQVRAVLRRRGAIDGVSITGEWIAPDDRWIRLVLDVGTRGGPVAVRDGAVVLDPAVADLLERSWMVPPAALAVLAGEALGAGVSRVARGAVGPAWFPGIALPSGVPEVLGRAFVLHATCEVWGEGFGPADPLGLAVAGGRVERRLAAGSAVLPDLRAWVAATGARCPIARL